MMNKSAVSSKKQLSPTETTISKLIRVGLILLFDVGASWFIYNAIINGYTQLATVVSVVAVMFNLIFLIAKAYPFRWMALGLGFMVLFTIYPIIFTIYVAFTNYGDGHLLTKEQAIINIEQITYMPETSVSYTWTAYKSAAGDYAL